MTSTEFPPIACTLGAADFKVRVGWIRELSAKSLRSHHRDGLMLELTYDECAAADVHEFVRREQTCCGLLRFEVRESADAVHLTITHHPRRRVSPTTCSLTSSPDRDHRRRVPARARGTRVRLIGVRGREVLQA